MDIVPGFSTSMPKFLSLNGACVCPNNTTIGVGLHCGIVQFPKGGVGFDAEGVSMGGEEILTGDGFPKDSRGNGMCVAVVSNDVGHELWMLFQYITYDRFSQ